MEGPLRHRRLRAFGNQDDLWTDWVRVYEKK